MAVPYGGEQWECNEPQRLQLCIYDGYILVFFSFTHCCQHGDYGIVGRNKNPSWEVAWTENWLGEYENCLINT